MGTLVYGEKVKLREKELGDARQDYQWQMDPELARLDASPSIELTFREYASEYSAQLRAPSQIRRMLSILTLEGKHIGNCSYYNINEKRRETELGIMIGDRAYWAKGYGRDTVRALLKYVFSETDMVQVHLKTLDWNFRAHRCFETCGFTRCGYLYRDGYSFILMEIKREKWLKMDYNRQTTPAMQQGERD